MDGPLCIKDFLLENGYTPVAILNIKGDFTMAELTKISEGKLFSPQTLRKSIEKAEFLPLWYANKNSHPNIGGAAEHYNYSTAYNGVVSMTNEELAVQIQLGATNLYSYL